MSVLTKLLRESYDLQESKGDESAYWHLQKLREAIKAEQIKGETLPIDSVVDTSVCDEPDETVEKCKCCKSFHEPDVCCYD